MSEPVTAGAFAAGGTDPMRPERYRIVRTWPETHDTFTLVLAPVEAGARYRFEPVITGVDPRAEQSWREYALAVLAFSAVSLLAMLRRHAFDVMVFSAIIAVAGAVIWMLLLSRPGVIDCV